MTRSGDVLESLQRRVEAILGSSESLPQGDLAAEAELVDDDEYGVEVEGVKPYTTTIDGVAVATGAIQDLPLTYYGPSIPLGPGWAYGGLESPASTVAATEQVTETAGLTATTVEPEATTTETTRTSSMTISSTTTSVSASSSFTSQLTGSSTTVSLSTASSLATSSTQSLSSSQSSSSSLSSTSTPSVSTSSVPSAADCDSNLVPLLPAVLVPLVVLALLILLGLCIYRRNRTYQPSTISPSDPPRWLPTPLAAVLYPSRRGYLPAVPPTTPPPKSRNLSQIVQSPNEKSALLTGFTPQHHRNSSSLSNARPMTDPQPDLSASDQSLLQRLGLGLGILSGSPSEPRKPSGFTLEKGLERSSYTALPPPPRRHRSDTASRPNGSGNESGEQTSSGNLRSIPDEQLFFRAPAATSSSKGTSSKDSSLGQGPGGRGWFSRYSNSGVSGLPPGAAAPHLEKDRSSEADGMSVAIPDTPGTAGEGSMREFGRRSTQWSSAERLRFPAPPRSGPALAAGVGMGGTFGAKEAGKRESMATSGSEPGSFHTAPSNADDPALLAPVGLPASAAPIGRTHKEYRHAALSAFGSNPPTPTGTPVQSPSQGPGSSSWDHSSEQPTSTSHASPSTIYPTRPGDAWSPFGAAMTEHPGTSHQAGDEDQDQDQDQDRLGPMRGLFVVSPPSSAGILGDGSAGERQRLSFPGEPLVDLRMSGGRVEQRTVGEFGERKPGPENSPTFLLGRGHAQEQSSETASIYSHPSRAASGGTGTGTGTGSSASHSSGGGGNHALTGALRGRRSQPQLLRASLLQPFSADEVATENVPPVPALPSLSLLPGGNEKDKLEGDVDGVRKEAVGAQERSGAKAQGTTRWFGFGR